MPSDSASYINRRSIHLSSRPPRFRPHRAPVNPELTRERIRAHPLRAGCSHSVHFLVREPCSRSSLWFRRCANQRVVGLPGEVGIVAGALIPRGNKPLKPWSPVPATLHCFHQFVELSAPNDPPARGHPLFEGYRGSGRRKNDDDPGAEPSAPNDRRVTPSGEQHLAVPARSRPPDRAPHELRHPLQGPRHTDGSVRARTDWSRRAWRPDP